MTYTFGGATSWAIDVSAGVAAPRNPYFCCGWWYPTALTSGRALWAAGTTSGVFVDTTTSEVRIVRDAITTPWEWTTTGVNLELNKWTFLAFFTNGTATPRVWMGTADTPPVEISVSLSITGSGSLSSDTFTYLGNTTALTKSFQGDIGFWASASTNDARVGQGPLGIAAIGTITQEESDLMLQRWVTPIWTGNLLPFFLEPNSVTGSNTSSTNWYTTLEERPILRGVTKSTIIFLTGPLQASVILATPSTNACPRRPYLRV